MGIGDPACMGIYMLSRRTQSLSLFKFTPNIMKFIFLYHHIDVNVGFQDVGSTSIGQILQRLLSTAKAMGFKSNSIQ